MPSSEPEPRTPTLIEKLIKSFNKDPKDQKELLDLLRDASLKGIIGESSMSMIEGVFHVKALQGRDIMVPRSRMTVLKYHDDFDALIKTVRDSGHSRFPVINENLDDVEGVLLAKDLLTYFDDNERATFTIKDVLRPAYFIPESRYLNTLLKDFKSKRSHMAVVVDEYGGTAGLVTIEDILEQIVGKIEDEHDEEEEQMIRSHGNNLYSVNALTTIDVFNAFFEKSITSPDFETIGGVVLHKFGDVPKRGETITVEGVKFKVLDVNKRRILTLQVVSDAL